MRPVLTTLPKIASRGFAALGLLALGALGACNSDDKPDPGDSGTTKTGATAASAQKGALLGVVRDMQGRVVNGAKVRASIDSDSLASAEFWRMMPIEMPSVAEATTAADGRFRIEVEAGPLYAVVATHNGTESNTGRVYVDRPFQLTIGTKQVPPDPDQDNRLGDGSVSGRVTSKATGRPVENAVLRRAWFEKPLSTSDSSGAFRVRWFSKSKSEPVFVFAKGYAIGMVPSAPFLEGKNTTYDLKLEKGIGIRGRVVDAKGNPVAGLTLLNETDILQDSTQYGAVPWRTTTDENGRWAFEEHRPGQRYWVRAVTPDGVTIEFAEGQLAADAKESIEIGDVAIGPTSAVHGTVTREDGRAIEQEPKPGEYPITPKVHFLKLWSKPPTNPLIMRNSPWVPIDGAGNYRIPRLAPGDYELAFWLGDNLEVEVKTVKIGRTPEQHRIDATVGAGREFRGLVVDENDKPIDGALLRAIPDWKNEYMPLGPRGKLDHPGRFLQGNVRVLTKPDGTYLLSRIRSGCAIQLRLAKEGFKSRKIIVSATEPPPDKIVLQR